MTALKTERPFDPIAHLHRLRTTGFSKLRPGRKHMRCPGCGRKQSNMPRGGFEPARAVLEELCCDNCCMGHKDCAPTYYTLRGREIGFEETLRAYEQWDEAQRR